MPRCYQQLTLADRRRLHHLVERKVPINEMARQLGRHRSTIYREIKRNTFRDHELPEYSGYFSTVADDKGAVENVNKRIRRFTPGDTDLAKVPQSDLVQLAHHLNDLPRKCLGYKTPSEVFLARLHEEG